MICLAIPLVPLVIDFPQIDPVAFSVGPVSIRWYGLAYMAGLLIGWLYVRHVLDEERLWKGPPPMLPDEADSLLLWMTFGVVVGGRLGAFLFYEPETLISDPLELFRTWHGGMAFHGGLLGSGLAMAIFARRHGVSLLSTFDLASAAVPIGLFFGRIANFINAELWGRPSDVPWAMVFPGAGPAPRHPSQLYEAALEGLVLFAVIRVMTHSLAKLRQPGYVTGVFLIGYGLARSFAELFRENDPNAYFDLYPLTSGMAYSLPMVLIGVLFVLHARRGLDVRSV
ncbi:MAG: prolipoprotein diacylglyceryl transferase [Hyphomicrobiaceae bacterium]